MPTRGLKRRRTMPAPYIAASRIQSAYRRYRGAGSSDQRQLRSVLRSHRKANPYQITPSSGRSVTFWRKTDISYQLNQSTGFQGAGTSVCFGFALGRLFGYTSGAFQISQQIPGFSEWQELFDYYKINAVKMQIFFTKTNNDQSSGNTLGMPMLLIANDFDDIQENMTKELMMQRVGCRHVQFDATNSNGIVHYLKPKPLNVVVDQDITNGNTGVAPDGVTFGSQWLNCGKSNIPHYGVKIFYNAQGLTTNTVLGNITFVFDIEYVFKGYR